MKILFIAPFNLKVRDGTSIRVYNLAKAASMFSKNVYLLAPSLNKDFELIKNLTWLKMPSLRPLEIYLMTLGNIVSERLIVDVLNKFLIDIKFLRNTDVDVIHAHWLLSLPIALAVKRHIKASIPILIDMHGSFTLQQPLPGEIKDTLVILLGKLHERFTIKHHEIKGITTPSYAFLKYLVKRYNLPFNNIHVVPDAIDLDLLRIRDFNHEVTLRNTILPKVEKAFKIIGYIGTTSYYHGFYDLLKSFLMVRRVLSNVKLMLVVPNANIAQHVIKKLKIPFDDIIIIENVPRSILHIYLRLTNALVLPHRAGTQFEYLPSNKLLDYMLSGKPIIAYNLSVIREFLKEYPNKMLVRPNDPSQLAKAILLTLSKEHAEEKSLNIYGNVVPTVPTVYDISLLLRDIYQVVKNEEGA